jgi:hypothetical protein
VDVLPPTLTASSAVTYARYPGQVVESRRVVGNALGGLDGAKTWTVLQLVTTSQGIASAAVLACSGRRPAWCAGRFL